MIYIYIHTHVSLSLSLSIYLSLYIYIYARPPRQGKYSEVFLGSLDGERVAVKVPALVIILINVKSIQ